MRIARVLDPVALGYTGRLKILSIDDIKQEMFYRGKEKDNENMLLLAALYALAILPDNEGKLKNGLFRTAIWLRSIIEVYDIEEVYPLGLDNFELPPEDPVFTIRFT